MEKRLCIYAIYQNDGQLKDYILYMVNSMSEIITDYIFVINGYLTHHDINKLNKYGRVICRENVGFDAAAYKYVIVNSFECVELDDYNQLILMNDTFCGSFFSWKKIFADMSQEPIDFWGLTKWKEGFSTYFNKSILEHIQSYFLVFSENVIQSHSFKDFWKELVIPNTYEQAIDNFEVALTQYLSKNGFRYGTWLEKCGGDQLFSGGEVVYITKPDELVFYHSFPILKKKACIGENIGALVNILYYLRGIELKRLVETYIRNSLREIGNIDLNALEKFFYLHKKIYFYGGGTYSKNLKAYFEYKNWKIRGIICSDKSNCKGSIALDELENCEDVGIIIATGKQFYEEIYEAIKKVCPYIDVITMCSK